MSTLAFLLLINVQAGKFNTLKLRRRKKMATVGANLNSRGNQIPVVATSHYTMFVVE